MADANAPALVLVVSEVTPDVAADYGVWYEAVHIPERMAVPGMRSGRRFQAVTDNPRPNRYVGSDGQEQLPRDPSRLTVLTFFEADNVDVENHPAYVALRGVKDEVRQKMDPKVSNVLRAVLAQVHPSDTIWEPAPDGIGGLFLVGLKPPPEHEDEFNAWYNTEHIPSLSSVPGVLRARRFVWPDGSRRYLSVYELTEPKVVLSEAWTRATKSPWTSRVEPLLSSWFRTTAIPLGKGQG